MRSPARMDTRPGIIYLAVNRVNGKAYVGKTGRGFSVRVAEHIYDSRNKSNTAFNRAIRKYGQDAFEFTVIEECPLDIIDERERHWIKHRKSRAPLGYNLTDGGDGTLGNKRTPEQIEKIRMANLGKPKSEEHRAKLRKPKSESARASARRVRASAEYRKRVSDANKRAWLTRSHEVQSERTKKQWERWREQRNASNTRG